MIAVIINGSAQTFAQAISIAELIRQMNLAGKRVAIECNGAIVPRGQYAQQMLAGGDKLEIVVAVGGG